MTVPADALIALAMAVGFFIVFYGPWQWICADFTRQFIFECRDRLFDIAAEGQLDFNSTEYRIIRKSLESHIRYAHEFNLPQLVMVMSLVEKYKLPPSGPTVDQVVASVPDPALRERLEKLVSDTTMALMVMACAKSIVLAPMAVGLVAVGYCTGTFRRILGWLENNNRVAGLTKAVHRGAQLAS